MKRVAQLTQPGPEQIARCQRMIWKTLKRDLVTASEHIMPILYDLVILAPTVPNVLQLCEVAQRLRVNTLEVRFMRYGFPAPRQLLIYLRLMYAAYLLREVPTCSIATVVRMLGYSSNQHFYRHLWRTLSATEDVFRQHRTFGVLLRHFTRHMLRRHRKALQIYREKGVSWRSLQRTAPIETRKGIRHSRCKTTEEQVREIRAWQPGRETLGELAARLHMPRPRVVKIRYRQTWTHM